jgi:RNA polymerase sigma factor for flagellar operon FliA
MTKPTHGPDDLGEGATTNPMNSGPAMPPDGTKSAAPAADQPNAHDLGRGHTTTPAQPSSAPINGHTVTRPVAATSPAAEPAPPASVASVPGTLGSALPDAVDPGSIDSGSATAVAAAPVSVTPVPAALESALPEAVGPGSIDPGSASPGPAADRSVALSGSASAGAGAVASGPAAVGSVAGGGAAGNGAVADGSSRPRDAGSDGQGVSVVTSGTAAARRHSFGAGQPDGVLPGDHRTADDVEAGIVALWRHYGSTHDLALRDRLMLHYAPLVKYVAGRVGTGLPAHVDVADLVQSGIFGLADAIEKFEPERGLKFETYAMQRIRGAILDELRSQDWVPRSVRGRARDVERALERLGNQLQRTPSDPELAKELQISMSDLRELYAQFQLTSVVALDELMVAGRGDASLAETLPDEGADDPVASLVDQDNRRQLADAIAQLSDRDRVVVTLYYFENLTLAEIGRVLGVTESRVCQLHTRAVLRLRTKLAEHADA